MALGVILVLTGMALVFARSMRTELVASSNRMSYAQADAVEQGAEQWVLAQTSTYQNDALTLTQLPAEAIQIGNGYFWLLHPNPTTDQTYMAGLVDESSKLNINTVSSLQLQTLPSMTPTAADSIIDWRDADETPQPNGAESQFYEGLAEPYEAKDAPFETVEELLLVNGWSPDLLFGYDVNRDGVVDPNEQAGAGNSTNGPGGSGTNSNGLPGSGNNSVGLAGAGNGSNPLANASGASRGTFNWLTCYTVEPNTATDGTARISVNSTTTTKLKTMLTSKINAGRATQIIAKITPRLRAARPPALPFASLGSFFTASGMTATEFGTVFDYLTATTAKTVKGLVNVNTAPLEVLECLPGLSESDAQTLVASQTTASSTPGISWVFTALGNPKTLGILSAITTRSYQYSADIVAVSGDGRSFKRVRIVVDTTTLPAKIVYHRDLTSYGWPLPPQIQQSMRSGNGPLANTGLFATPGTTQVNGLTH
jgi:type II secretory pathway component PulK